MIDDLNNDLERAQYLQNIMISIATGGTADDRDYQSLRKIFVSKPETKDLLPSFVKANRDLTQFW